MIWHPRADWVTTEPVTGPPLPWPQIDGIVIHYTAAPNLIDGDAGESWSQMPAYLRAIHHDYLTNRKPSGYSIGYNLGVDQRGEAWELRGWDIKSAATLGHNDHLVAILVLVDGADPASPAAVATIRELVAGAERRAGRQLTIRGHRDYAATACPGAGIYAQIAEGLFSPRYATPVPPPPIELPDPAPSTPTEDDMQPELIRFKGYWNEILETTGGPIHGTVEQVERWRPLYGVPADPDDPGVTAGRKALVIDPNPVSGQRAKFISTLHRLGLQVADLTPSGGL